MADLLLHWITGGRSDLATLLQADEILSGSGTDARQQQVVEMVRRLATGQITWEQYASETKKRLIRHRLPKRPPTPPGAIGLVAAARALEQMLVDANAADGALLESVWYVVNAFARLPVSPPEGSFIQDDMCLFEWGITQPGTTPALELRFTRQFVLYDEDGDYDRMEHVSATLAFDPPDEAGLDVGTGGLWSDNDLDSWRSDVEQLNVFAAARHHRPRSLTVAQEEV